MKQAAERLSNQAKGRDALQSNETERKRSGLSGEYNLGFALVGPIVVFLCWEILHLMGFLEASLFPSPGRTLMAMSHIILDGKIFGDLGMTFLRMFAGFALAAIVGISIGLMMGAWRPVYYSVLPIMDFFRSIPVTALYPMFVLLLGISNASKIGMVFTASVFVVALNTAYGVLRANPVRLEMARLYGASGPQLFWQIMFFDSLPQTMIGLRVAVSYALIVEVLCEMFMGSNLGLGQRIMEAYTTYAIDQMYGLVLLTGICGFGINRLFIWFERIAIPWCKS